MLAEKEAEEPAVFHPLPLETTLEPAKMRLLLAVTLEQVPGGSEGPLAWPLGARRGWGYPLHQNPALWQPKHKRLLTTESGNTGTRIFFLIRITAASKYPRTGG